MHYGAERHAGVTVDQLETGGDQLGLVGCGTVELFVDGGWGEKPAAWDPNKVWGDCMAEGKVRCTVSKA